MNYTEFFQRFDKKDAKLLPADFDQRVGASLSIQIHSTGARPKYSVQHESVTPETYNKKFDKLFKHRLLNRHPNESDDSYNWRLSIYSPIAKEIIDRFINFVKGSIMQTNSYVVSLDAETSEVFSEEKIADLIDQAIDFTINNPQGFMAVIVKDYDGMPTSVAIPSIEFIEPDHVKMYDDNSIAFVCDGKLYFLDKNIQVVRPIGKGEPIQISHNFGSIPAWACDNNFVQPFVHWADLLVRNMSDDEMMTKQYSYPIKQLVESECSECVGTGIIQTQDDLTQQWMPHKCKTCSGKGTISINPGEVYTISESRLAKLGGTLPDVARFITPDVGIPEYHLRRWQTFYERCEKSLYLNKKINGTESGDAKKEDRKDQYTYLLAFANHIFNNLKRALTYSSAYVNYNGQSGRFEAAEVIVQSPKRFDLMSDIELVDEMLMVQAKSDDSMVLSEVQYAVANNIYRGDDVLIKINEILYQTDQLYGISGVALQRKYLSGMYTEREKMLHEKGYRILINIAREMSYQTFNETENVRLIAMLNERLDTMTPQGIYE